VISTCWKLRWTGEQFAAERDPEPTVDKGTDSPERFRAASKSLKGVAERRELWLTALGFNGGGPVLPLDDEDLDPLL